MEFTRKARFCAGGHTTDTPAAMTYSSVVSRDSVQIGFMLAALNGLDMMACNLENAYLNGDPGDSPASSVQRARLVR
jgi:hypothetical protein